MNSLLQLSKFRTALLITSLQIIVAWLFFGAHHGWIDDLFFELLFRQEVLVEGKHKDVIFVFFILQTIFYWLYEIGPNIPWVGLYYSILLIGSTLCINYIICTKLKGKKQIQVLLSIFFFFGFLLKLIVFPNFTTISIFTSFCAIYMFNLEEKVEKSFGLLSLVTLFYIAGFLIRPPTAILATLIFAPLIRYQLTIKRNLFHLTIPKLIIFSYIIVGAFAFIVQDKSHYYWDRKRSSILDTGTRYHLNQIKDTKTKAFTEAYLAWFFADKEVFQDIALMDQMAQYKVKRNLIIKYKEKLQGQLAKITNLYSAEYHKGLNWGIELLLIILLLIPLILMDIRKTNQTKFYILYYLSVITLFFSIILMYKLEYRFFYPLLIFLFFFLLIKHQLEKNSIRVVLCILIGLSTYQISSVYQTVLETKQSNKSINETIRNLNSQLPTETIIFDQISVSILHNGPFNHFKINNNWISILETFNMASKEHNEQLTKIFGCPDFPCMVEKAKNNKDFVFLFNESRIAAIENYYAAFYNTKITFSKHPDSNEIIKTDYSIFNFPLNIHLYYLTD